MKAENTTVQLPVTVFDGVADKDIELENTLADYLPNINRIIRADADIVCEEVQLSDGKAEVGGKAVFTLLYESDFKQKLCCEKFSTEFTQRFDVRELPDGELIPIPRAKCSYVGCKTLNPRRFILRCRADVGLQVRCMQNTQIVSTADCKGAFFKTEKLVTPVYAPQTVRDFSAEEQITLETLPAIEEIIYTSLVFSHSEVSISEGSALIRSEAVFKCLYEGEGEDAVLHQLSRRFPAVFTIEDDSITEQSEISVELTAKGVEAEKDIDAYGESRVITLKYSARVTLACTNRKELDVPTDMFFEDYECENKIAELWFEECAKNTSHRFVLEKVFEIPEMTLDSCMDINADLNVNEVSVGENGITVKGGCGMNILGADGNGYRAYDFTANFTENIPLRIPEGSTVKATAKSISASAEVLGGRLSVRIPAEITVSSKYKKRVSALVGAEIESRNNNGDSAKPVIIYYPAKNESAWDIGKRYHVSPKTVINENSGMFDKNGNVCEDGAIIYM